MVRTFTAREFANLIHEDPELFEESAQRTAEATANSITMSAKDKAIILNALLEENLIQRIPQIGRVRQEGFIDVQPPPTISPEAPEAPQEPEPAQEFQTPEEPKPNEYRQVVITMHGESPGDKSKGKSPIDFEMVLTVIIKPEKVTGLMREIVRLIQERIPISIGEDSRTLPTDETSGRVVDSRFTFRGRKTGGGHVERSNQLASEAVRQKANQYLSRNDQ